MDTEYKGDYKLKLEKLKKLSLDPKPTFHKITCPSCSKGVPSTNLSINDKIAKCDHCDAVFSFKEEIKDLLVEEKVKQEIIRPEGIDLFHFQEELDITLQQPYSVWSAILLFFGTLLGILFTFITIVKPGTTVIALTIASWLLTVYPIYSWINHSKNKIFISINERLLNIEWRPKKGKKDQSFDRQDIDQLYLRRGEGGFNINMIINGLEGQKHILLVPRVNSLSKARYLEQEIEKHLGIIDREVLEENV